MRGNYFNDPRLGATGERLVPEGAENYEIYEDEHGNTRTRILDNAVPAPA